MTTARTDQDVLDAVRRAHEALPKARAALDAAVASARTAGASWTELGRVLQISRQGAQRRWGRKP